MSEHFCVNSRLALSALLVILSPGCAEEDEDPRVREEKRRMEVLRRQEDDPKSILAAAQSGNASAQEDMGIRYAEGRGVKKNLEEAVSWFRKAADQGASNSQYRLGMCYYRGKGIAKDIVQAHGWLTLSAANGCQAAQKIIPTISGEMTPEQKIEAARHANEIFEQLKAPKQRRGETNP
jgi:hypothetical protein